MKKFWLVCICLVFSLGVIAQPKFGEKKMNRKEFFEFRYKYLTEKAGFTEEEAAKFAPLYEELEQQKFQLGDENRKMTDGCEKQLVKDYDAVVRKILENQLTIATMERDFYDKVKHIVTPEKFLRFHQAEIMFGREMLKKFRRPEDSHRRTPKQYPPKEE